jgi:glutamyl-tRNA reductase
MELSVIGLNHDSAPVEIREKLSSGTMDLGVALVSLHDSAGGGLILSTCNRTELYVIGDDEGVTRQKATEFLHSLSGLPPMELVPYVYTHTQEEAVRHLFKVASGLDSMIIGEYEILGQVRRALEVAENVKVTPAPLLNLFRHAVSVGRRVRDETSISRNAASVSSVAVEIARRALSDLSSCQVLVIGAGEAGRLATQALVKNGVSQIVVASRSYESAAQLASEINSGAIPMRSIEEALTTSDIVVSCSNSPHFVLEPSVVTRAMELRPKRPLVIMDIAVPRDVDPETKDINNVFLHDIDDLTMISDSNRQQREEEMAEVLRIINAEVARLMAWWNSMEMAPTIAALVDKGESIRRERVERALSKMNSLSEEDRSSIEEMTKSIVRRILHDPILALKRDNGSQYGPTVQELFNLSDDLDPGEGSVEQK